jgi:hypothetical protein
MAKEQKPTLVVDKPRGKPRTLQPGPRGGMLMSGGTNKGGPGRPKSVVRAAYMESFAARLKVLEDIADGVPVQKTTVLGVGGKDGIQELEAITSASPGERIRAIDTMGKYGIGVQTETEHSGGAVFEMVVRHEVPTRRIS